MRFAWLPAAALLIASPASAQRMMVLGAGGPFSAAAPPSYTGPGDIVGSALGWWGLRGYSGAVAATGTQPSVNVRRSSDNVACDILIATNGDLGLTISTCNSSTQGGISPTAFAGTDATGTGAITGTTLTFTGGHVGDVVTGGGTLAGTYIVSGSNPTWTVNNSQTVASSTLTLTYGLYVTKIYDQSGGGSGDALHATAGNQPQLLTAGCSSGALPCIVFVGSSSRYLQTGAITSTAQPVTFSVVAIRTGTFTSENSMITTYNGGGIINEFYAATSKMVQYAGSFSSQVSITDSVWHAVQSIENGASSTINVDDTKTTTSPGTNATGTGGVAIGARLGGSVFLTGSVSEAGLWGSGFSTGNQTSMCHNQFVYWGTATSC